MSGQSDASPQRVLQGSRYFLFRDAVDFRDPLESIKTRLDVPSSCGFLVESSETCLYVNLCPDFPAPITEYFSL